MKKEVVIVGGGMVGAAAALGLAKKGLDVLLLEKRSPQPFSVEQEMDLRVSAINLGSEALLTQLGVWPHIEQMRLCEYRRLGVWEKDNAYIEFNSDDISKSHLGHIIENRVIQLALWQELETCGVDVLSDIAQYTINPRADEKGYHQIEVDGQAIQARVLLAADGAHSQIRQQFGIGTTGWDYRQSAMLINVELPGGQQDITWQQFTPSGPKAFLPLPGNFASLVWYDQTARIQALSSMDNQALGLEIAKTFPSKLAAGIKVVSKGAFPLTRRHANAYVKQGAVLLGDAAHSINPLAGQGVNLGFRDVSALLELIEEHQADSWYLDGVLSTYEGKRRKDNLLMMTAMDALYKGFSNEHGIISGLRNAAFYVVSKQKRLQQQIMKYAAGI